MATLPLPDPNHKLKPILNIDPMSIEPEKGCPIQAGCPNAISKCFKERPNLIEIQNDHYVACHNIF